MTPVIRPLSLAHRSDRVIETDRARQPTPRGRIPNFPCHVAAGMKDGFAMFFSRFQRPALK